MGTIIGIITVLGLLTIGYFLFKDKISPKKEEPIEPGPGYPKPPKDEEGTPLPKNPKVKE